MYSPGMAHGIYLLLMGIDHYPHLLTFIHIFRISSYVDSVDFS